MPAPERLQRCREPSHPSGCDQPAPALAKALHEQGVELRVDEKAKAILLGTGLPLVDASSEDFATEYNDLIISITVVPDTQAAIQFINANGSGHSDAIVTQDDAQARAFLAGIDSATVYHNASTRFTDGYEFGLGAEIGISTDRLHARGPMGLNELCTYKYVIHGKGRHQVRQSSAPPPSSRANYSWSSPSRSPISSAGLLFSGTHLSGCILAPPRLIYSGTHSPVRRVIRATNSCSPYSPPEREGSTSKLILLARIVNGAALLATALICAQAAGRYWKKSRAVWITGLLIGLNPVLAFGRKRSRARHLAVLCLAMSYTQLLPWLRQTSLKQTLLIATGTSIAYTLDSTVAPFLILWPVAALLYPVQQRLAHLLASALPPLLAVLATVFVIQLQNPLPTDFGELARGIYETFNSHEASGPKELRPL